MRRQRRRQRGVGPLAGVWLAGWLAAAVHAQTVEVFTDAAWPVTGQAALARQGLTVIVYDLSAPAAWETTLSVGLPADPDQALSIARSRLRSIPTDELRRQVEASQRGEQRRQQLGLVQLPAVVIDGQIVVYGLIDLAAVWARYRQWQERP